ncbi:hypothetical protein ACFXPT_36405 [Streptomyces goshikiensis]|uniref:hypothetical protein n=1 Tax=Streptomyces goshikiensis TaxID=1942 RepID=UPI0036A2845E
MEETFLRFLAQSAVPDAQMATVGEAVRLVGAVIGSAATLTPASSGWAVREAGPLNLCGHPVTLRDEYRFAGIHRECVAPF